MTADDGDSPGYARFSDSGEDPGHEPAHRDGPACLIRIGWRRGAAAAAPVTKTLEAGSRQLAVEGL
jgi:hypothetical protein